MNLNQSPTIILTPKNEENSLIISVLDQIYSFSSNNFFANLLDSVPKTLVIGDIYSNNLVPDSVKKNITQISNVSIESMTDYLATCTYQFKYIFQIEEFLSIEPAHQKMIAYKSKQAFLGFQLISDYCRDNNCTFIKNSIIKKEYSMSGFPYPKTTIPTTCVIANTVFEIEPNGSKSVKELSVNTIKDRGGSIPKHFKVTISKTK